MSTIQASLPMPLPPATGPLRERASQVSWNDLLDEMAHDCWCSASCLAECMATDCPVREMIP